MAILYKVLRKYKKSNSRKSSSLWDAWQIIKVYFYLIVKYLNNDMKLVICGWKITNEKKKKKKRSKNVGNLKKIWPSNPCNLA